jgi:predicted dehydrogenase
VALGVIGLGPMWDRRYRQAAQSLGERLVVRAVYDAVFARAQVAAAELGAEAVPGLRTLFERTDIQAWLILDPAWYDLFPAELACQARKPAFLTGSLGDDRAALLRLHTRAEESQTWFMTEFSRRYTPATNRLRELIATRLGEPRQLTIDALVPSVQGPSTMPGQACERDYLAGLIDWCQYVTGRIPASISAQTLPTRSTPAEDHPWQIDLGFRPDSYGKSATTARLRIQPVVRPEGPTANDGGHSWNVTTDAWPSPLHEVLCEHGRAVICDPGEIRWRNGAPEPLATELLLTERSDAEVMLDQFLRRVLGGLVPVANLQDVCRVLEWVEAAEHCRAARTT